MAETSTSYCELLNGLPSQPLPGVGFAAHIVLFKRILCCLFVAVDLPASHTLVLAGSILDKT